MNDAKEFLIHCPILRNGRVLERLKKMGVPDIEKAPHRFAEQALRVPFSTSERLCLMFGLSLAHPDYTVSLWEIRWHISSRETLDLMARSI